MKTVILFTFFATYLKTIKTTEYCSGIPLTGISIKPACSRSGANTINCADPVKEGTIARISCAVGYNKTNEDDNDTIFCNSGRWSGKLFQCEPMCGMRDVDIKKRTPWHALIYVKSNAETLSCSGTIISVKLIISAARCVWDNEQNKATDILNVEVQVGNLNQHRFSTRALKISEIHIPKGFKDITSSFENDIAILVMKDPIQYTAKTLYTNTKYAACIEWLNQNAKSMRNEVKGYIPTGKFDRDGYSTDLIYSECEYSNNLNGDKVFEISCRNVFEGQRNCSADIGGGFVVRKIVDGVERDFLRGVLTNEHTASTDCPNNYSVKITNIQHHWAMISEYMKKYSVEYDLKRSISFPCQVSFIPNLKISLEEHNGTRRNLMPGDYVNGLNKIIYSCEDNYGLIGTTTNYCYYDILSKSGKWAENHPVCIPSISKPTPAPPEFACGIPNIPYLILLDWNLKEITMNYAEDGNRVRYKCNENYHLIGKSENLCSQGEWMWDYPTCKNTSAGSPSNDKCAVPLLPDTIIILEGHIRKNVSIGNYVENDNSISYSCIRGRLLHGVTSNYCYEGRWLSEHPACIKFTVGVPTKDNCELPRIQNGVTVVESVVKESESSSSFVRNYQQIWFKCKNNYQLEGESTNICNNGVWKNEQPRCIKITADSCEVPAISNLEVVLEGEVKKTLSFGSYVENFNIISYRCKKNQILQGRSTNNCINGKWTDEHPTCIKYCSSDTLKGVTFSAICEFNGARIPCDRNLRTGTIARIYCQFGYRKVDPLAPEAIICDDTGNWDSNPNYRCEPMCGTEYSETVPYIKGGEKANITAVPWHAAIYSLLKGKYSQICGGTIISSNVIVSAAHCFWQGPELVVDHTNISVGVGKYFRDYYALEPLTPQLFNLSEIHIPEGFKGPIQAYHDDIAILVLNGYIEFKPYIKPICIKRLDEKGKSIQSGLLGRVAGWGKTSSELPSEELKMLDISTLSYTDCVNAAEVRFRNQISSDKFCVFSPDGNDESTCQGDSGGGFFIHEVNNGEKTYFLWGIVSIGLTDKNECKTITLASLTNIQLYYDKILYYRETFRIK